VTDHDTTAAGRVQAYLDAADHQCAVMRMELSDVIAWVSPLGRETEWLKVADLRAVLAEHRQMRDELAAHAERESADAAAGSYAARAERAEAERDNAYRSILLIAQSLASLATFELTRDPDSTAWNIVNASAQTLLAAGRTSLVGGWQPADEASAQRDLNLPQGQE
jgi:hypothetical protein